MKVFVTGGTGIIGSAVAGAFARAGHDTAALVRSAEKGRGLERDGIQAVVGTMQEAAGWRPAAREAEVLIHCAVEYSGDQWALNHATLDAMIALARESGRPRCVIGTGGVWSYGDTGDGRADEASPLNPPELSKPRVAVDERVLSGAGGRVRTVLIRPGCVYGGNGSLTASWFESAATAGAARIVGFGTNRWAMVHRDDLADLYVRAAESDASGEVFNATDRSRFTVLDCARASSRAAGAHGQVASVPLEEARKTMGPMADCLVMNQHVDSGKAARRLGWNPRHAGFADEAEALCRAWRAHT